MSATVEAARHLRMVVPQVLALMDVTNQEKRELAVEVYTHAVVLLHRVVEATSCTFTLPHLVVTCAVLGCKLVIDDDVRLATYSEVIEIPYLGSIMTLPRDFVDLEFAIMHTLDFRLMAHFFRQ